MLLVKQIVLQGRDLLSSDTLEEVIDEADSFISIVKWLHLHNAKLDLWHATVVNRLCNSCSFCRWTCPHTRTS
jgi:hypothetical protein